MFHKTSDCFTFYNKHAIMKWPPNYTIDIDECVCDDNNKCWRKNFTYNNNSSWSQPE